LGTVTQTPLVIPLRGPFSPRFLLQNETAQYGLPDANRQPNILALVDGASTLIDQHCGRTDGWGQGSLVYSTYMERIPLQARGRNVVRVSFKPMVGVDATTANALAASANMDIKPDTNPLFNKNWFWTGVQASIISNPQIPGNTLSPIIGCSGRYGYARRPDYVGFPDMNYGMNPLMIASMFGGAPGFTPIDVSKIDVMGDVGEIWVPAGIMLSSYTEIVCIYNSGFHPLYLPSTLKQACAMVVKNSLSRGGGVSALRSITAAGTANVSFTPDLIDSNIDNILDPFKNVVAF
jgi:hypothetical protein